MAKYVGNEVATLILNGANDILAPAGKPDADKYKREGLVKTDSSLNICVVLVAFFVPIVYAEVRSVASELIQKNYEADKYDYETLAGVFIGCLLAHCVAYGGGSKKGQELTPDIAEAYIKSLRLPLRLSNPITNSFMYSLGCLVRESAYEGSFPREYSVLMEILLRGGSSIKVGTPDGADKSINLKQRQETAGGGFGYFGDLGLNMKIKARMINHLILDKKRSEEQNNRPLLVMIAESLHEQFGGDTSLKEDEGSDETGKEEVDEFVDDGTSSWPVEMDSATDRFFEADDEPEEGISKRMVFDNKKYPVASKLLGLLEFVLGLVFIAPWLIEFIDPTHNIAYDTLFLILALGGAFLVKKGIDNLRRNRR